jgi:hypothetical protein
MLEAYLKYGIAILLAAHTLREKKNLRRQWKNTPHINDGNGATLVPVTVKLHQKKKRINGDQEGCRLDLKPASGDSW